VELAVEAEVSVDAVVDVEFETEMGGEVIGDAGDSTNGGGPERDGRDGRKPILELVGDIGSIELILPLLRSTGGLVPTTSCTQSVMILSRPSLTHKSENPSEDRMRNLGALDILGETCRRETCVISG